MEFTSPCPASDDLAAACGIPLAVACLPLPGAPHVPPADAPSAAELGRCTSCLAYICRLCQFGNDGFACALCGSFSDYTSSIANLRYASPAARAQVPELAGDVYEAACSLAPSSDEGDEGAEALEAAAAPVLLALVDATGPAEWLDQVADALSAALEALPPDARFGLVLFGSQLGLCAPSASAPAVHHVPLLRLGQAPTPVELQDALPLDSLLASVGSESEKAAAQQCIEAALRPGAESGERCAGPALQAVLRYLAGRTQPGACRVMLFLAGPPNAQRGSVVREASAGGDQQAEQGQHAATDFLDPSFPELSAWQASPRKQQRREGEEAAAAAGGFAAALPAGREVDLRHAAPPGVAAAELDVDWRAAEFWEQAGSAAAALGIQVDVWAACEDFVGLELLEPVCRSSGGSMVLYTSPQEASLPQDVYKRLSTPSRSGCLLRLRTSPELQPLRCHPASWAVPDEQHPQLFHVVAASADDAFIFELRRTSAPLRGTPAVQLVSQGSTVQAAPDGRSVLRRWLRVHTVALPVASSPLELWSGCSPDVLAALMTHLAASTAERRGAEAARHMLVDWLALLAVATSRGGRADASLSVVDRLALLPGLAYGLMASPLLQPATPGQHPDLAAFVRALWLSLPPSELATALYPRLSSWKDADAVAVGQHRLTRSALAACEDAPLLLLDTYWQLVVLRRRQSGADLPFPPPKQSTLRAAVDGMRQARRVTPQVSMLQEAEDAAAAVLERALIEDADDGFASLLQVVQQQAQKILTEEEE